MNSSKPIHDFPIADVKTYFMQLQQKIVDRLNQFDQSSFLADPWKKQDHPLQGHGNTYILENGSFFERAGVGFSHVQGTQLPQSARAIQQDTDRRPFEALGVSLVLHPRNPFCPTVHMNVRLICLAAHNDEPTTFWFGGGMDLTPIYPFLEDVQHFHRICRQSLTPFGQDLYPRFKKWCDEYFYLPHRQETRGVGGIFFDYFSELGFEQSFAMTKNVGDAFLEAYLPIIQARHAYPYGEKEQAFQAYRRGRYVEFNLVYDRGTLFGLQSKGRTESILLSMPPHARWEYNWQPEQNSLEANLHQYFLTPREWLSDTP